MTYNITIITITITIITIITITIVCTKWIIGSVPLQKCFFKLKHMFLELEITVIYQEQVRLLSCSPNNMTCPQLQSCQ